MKKFNDIKRPIEGNIAKKLAKINLKNWHTEMQEHLCKKFQNIDIDAVLEKTISIPEGGNKTRRRADIFLPDWDLVIEVQKSTFITKEFQQRNEDYKRAGLNVTWIFNEERWQPDTTNNSQLSKEPYDLYIKWRPYLESLGPAHSYNSNRYFILDYVAKHPDITLFYCLTERGELTFREVTRVEVESRILTPKFPSERHYKRGPDLKDQNQPKETFTALNVHTDMICLDSLPEAICA